jgi:hypothetical protein
MSTKANEVSEVIVKTYVDPISTGGPIVAPIIEVEEILINGSGTLSTSIFGGSVKYYLVLSQYESKRPLQLGQAVFASGKHNGGQSFSINLPLETVQTGRPAQFVGPYKEALP